MKIILAITSALAALALVGCDSQPQVEMTTEEYTLDKQKSEAAASRDSRKSTLVVPKSQTQGYDIRKACDYGRALYYNIDGYRAAITIVENAEECQGK